MEDIWFFKGGGCDENYDDWYFGWLLNQFFVFLQFICLFVYFFYFEFFMILMVRCIWYNGVIFMILWFLYIVIVRFLNLWFDVVFYYYVVVDFLRGLDGWIIWFVVEIGIGGVVVFQIV